MGPGLEPTAMADSESAPVLASKLAMRLALPTTLDGIDA